MTTQQARVRILALGNRSVGDDAAGIEAAQRLDREFEVFLAGRPGAGLLDLLADGRPTVLVDVTRSAQPIGRIIELPFEALVDATVAEAQVSSHGFGPSETLRLGAALGRPLPPGTFVGIEGGEFQVGEELSPAVAAAMEAFVAAIRRAATSLGGAHDA